jgi:penicillin-binding protein 2
MALQTYTRDLLDLRKRFRWAYLVVLVCFLILVGRFLQLQVVSGDKYLAMSQANIVRVHDIPSYRGTIRDLKGRVLATNRPSYELLLTPAFFDYEEDFETVCDYLSLTPAERETLAVRYREQEGLKAYQPMLVKENITRDELALFETHKLDLPGVKVAYRPIRVYPLGRVGAHTIGYLNEVKREDIDGHPERGYKPGDLMGRSGLERSYEPTLRGRRGWYKTIVDVKGVVMDDVDARQVVNGPLRKEPIPGKDVTTTLDADLMKLIDKAFLGYPAGAAAVVDVQTGRILALYSKPAYNSTTMTGGLTREALNEMNENPFHPWIDRTIMENYFPGSTFKTFPAIAALESKTIGEDDSVNCPGFLEIGNRIYRCSGQHGLVNIRKAIVYSCNVFFYNLAVMVGMDRIGKYARDYGFGERTGLGLAGEVPGFVPSRQWYVFTKKVRFRPGYTMNMAIGQGNLKVTLLQLALGYAAVANGGFLYYPQIVKSIEEPDGTPVQRFLPEVRRTVPLSARTRQILQEAMTGVIEDPLGTAYGNAVEGVSIGGKTGTAQVARQKRKKGQDMRDFWYFSRDHAWFIAFAPADNPELVAVVLVEHGGTGGKTAAPIATSILGDYLKEMY